MDIYAYIIYDSLSPAAYRSQCSGSPQQCRLSGPNMVLPFLILPQNLAAKSTFKANLPQLYTGRRGFVGVEKQSHLLKLLHTILACLFSIKGTGSRGWGVHHPNRNQQFIILYSLQMYRQQGNPFQQWITTVIFVAFIKSVLSGNFR